MVVLFGDVLLFLQGVVHLLGELVAHLEDLLLLVGVAALLFGGLLDHVQGPFHHGEAEHHLDDVASHHPTLDHVAHARFHEGYRGVVVLEGL